jgi:ribosomal protein S18 acetylase RimI-like enzyme
MLNADAPSAPEVALVQRYEMLTVQTAPAVHEAQIGPWMVRASANHITRANSACLLDRSIVADEAVSRLADVEAWYASQSQPTILRLNAHLVPDAVFNALAEAGYQPGGRAWLMRSTLMPSSTATIASGFQLVDCALADGVAQLCVWKGLDAAATSHELARQSRFVGAQRMRAVVDAKGNIVTVGMARCVGDDVGTDVGIFAMHTAPEVRRSGFARLLVNDLLNWGRGQGATHGFLQVDDGNAAAIALYEQLGFRHLYCYQTFTKTAA